MIKIKQIEKMLATEKYIAAKEKKMAGVSVALVRADIRAECLEEMLKILR